MVIITGSWNDYSIEDHQARGLSGEAIFLRRSIVKVKAALKLLINRPTHKTGVNSWRNSLLPDRKAQFVAHLLNYNLLLRRK